MYILYAYIWKFANAASLVTYYERFLFCSAASYCLLNKQLIILSHVSLPKTLTHQSVKGINGIKAVPFRWPFHFSNCQKFRPGLLDKEDCFMTFAICPLWVMECRLRPMSSAACRWLFPVHDACWEQVLVFRSWSVIYFEMTSRNHPQEELGSSWTVLQRKKDIINWTLILKTDKWC